MSLTLLPGPRRIIPRWRDFTTTLALGELDRVRSKVQASRFFREEYFIEALQRWHRHSTTENAADALVSAFALGREADVRDAAILLASRDAVISPALRRIADAVLSGRTATTSGTPVSSESTIHADIARIRRRLNAFPRNAFLWGDLSRLYIVKAQPTKSRHAMEVALGLAPDNRFILRSAARLFLHLREPDRAHDMLSASPATSGDPWLVAAEIAVASVAERPPRHLGHAKHLLDRGDYSPADTAELASAIATEELFSGRHRKARRLFSRSLTEPTENAVAQAEWAVETLPALEVTRDALDVPHSFEANALNSFHSADWTTSVRRCQEWAFDEPFSKRPSALGSYIALVALEDYVLAKSLADQGLRSNPKDPLLTNNLAVALVNMGQKDEARQLLATIPRPVKDHAVDAVLRATEGLVHFRSGDLDRGRVLYREAIEAFRPGNPRAHALAMLHLAREEFLAHTNQWKEHLSRAEALWRASKTPDVEAMLVSLRKQTSASLGQIESRPDWVKSLRVESIDTYAVNKRMREALKGRSWLVDLVAAKPFSIEADIDGSKLDAISRTAPLTLFSPLSVDISSAVTWEDDTVSDRVLFLALYPSGAVRSIPAKLQTTGRQSYLVLESPVALVDPELSTDVLVSADMHCSLVVQPISSLANGE